MLAKDPNLRFIQMLTTMIGHRGVNSGRDTNAGIAIQWRDDNFHSKQRQFCAETNRRLSMAKRAPPDARRKRTA